MIVDTDQGPQARATDEPIPARPSARYRQLIDQYRHMHAHGSPESGLGAAETFPGQSLAGHLAALLELVRKRRIRTMLDYGCGKAMLYRPEHRISAPDGSTVSCVQDLLGVRATLYDPAYPPFMDRPRGRFDLVVCTDVLEHCPETDLPWILSDLFGYARMALYANIATYPARKHLPNGENAHCTVRPAAWWRELIEPVAGRHPDVRYRFLCSQAPRPDDPDRPEMVSIANDVD